MKDLDQPHINIAVSYGSVYHTLVEKVFKKANIQKFNGLSEVGQSLLVGQADAVIDDRVWVNHFVSQNRDTTSALTNIIGQSFPAAIAVNKEQGALLDTINILE